MTVSPNRTAPLSTLGARPGLGLGLKFGLLATAAATCLVAALTISPRRAQDANAVIAKVNGAEIRQSDLTVAEEELGPSLQQMDPASRRDNLIAFLIDMKIVAKA
ncbi:MAG: peptidylprolyl isomerase, partial [Afipia sp.]